MDTDIPVFTEAAKAELDKIALAAAPHLGGCERAKAVVYLCACIGFREGFTNAFQAPSEKQFFDDMHARDAQH